MKNIIILSLAALLFFPSLGIADHLSNKSNAETLKMHKFRLDIMPIKFHTQLIPPSPSPILSIPKTNINPVIRKVINNSDLLSVMYFDGESIRTNELDEENLMSTQKMYSMSISKSFVGYLVGQALCDGFFRSLDDPIHEYVPETMDTVYEGVSLQDMINMSAGDSALFEGRQSINEYARPILAEQRSIISFLEASRGKQRKKAAGFRYSNMITDLVARAIDVVTPMGFADYFLKKIVVPARMSSETMYFKDKNNWGILFAFLYATRDDYMKFGQLIANDWISNNCSGSFLKTFYRNRVPTGTKLTGSSYKSYGGFFWTDKEDFNFKHLSMLGHGGQRIIVNLDAGSVLTLHAIRNNFSTTKLERIFFR
tara:strand:- start:1126 stop:2232 length:1107 start_codon:yes stop_codon:yes gene_type:complete